MASTGQTLNIPSFLSASLATAEKLSEDNWAEWSKNMEMFFIGAGADWITSGLVPTGQENTDKMFVAYIYASLEPEQRYRLTGIKSGVAAWTLLKTAYNKSTMGRRIRARDALDSIEHDTSRPMDFYIQTVTNAFQALKNLGETVSDTTIGDHLLRHLDPSFYPVRTTILAQEKELDLAKIEAILVGSAASEYTIKTEAGLFANGGRNSKSGRPDKNLTCNCQPEPATDGFLEGNFKWCNKGNGTSCHRCGRSGHISRLCTRDMPSSIKDLVIEGARAHAARLVYAGDLFEQESQDESGDIQFGLPRPGVVNGRNGKKYTGAPLPALMPNALDFAS